MGVIGLVYYLFVGICYAIMWSVRLIYFVIKAIFVKDESSDFFSRVFDIPSDKDNGITILISIIVIIVFFAIIFSAN